MAIVQGLLDLVGGTSVVKLHRIVSDRMATIWCKCEQQNPGGSVKDRICVAMIEDAERRGLLAAGGTVIEPTSGNTGIGLAIACAVKGYKLVLTMPESMSLERRALLEAYGAEVVLTPEQEQMDGAIRRAHEIASQRAGAFVPRQFENPANPAVHEATTARELLDAFAGESIDAFVAAVGTGGTVTGVGRALKRERPAVKVVAVEPESCATISRGERGPTKIQGIGAGFVPSNYDATVVDEVMTVADRDAWDAKVRLAREEGLLVGISSGANVNAALRVAERLGPGKNVVTVLCETGERYFSLRTYFREETRA
jgi:cysteine synthase A